MEHTLSRRFPDEPGLAWSAREVLLDLDERPHLLVRLELQGDAFPHLDAQPFVRVAARRAYAESWFARVAEEGTSIAGYFAVDGLPAEGLVEYGYGDRVFGRVPAPFEPLRVKQLDRQRLPEDVVVVDERFLKRKRGGKLEPAIRMPEPRRRGRAT
jgi:hypothetical protein